GQSRERRYHRDDVERLTERKAARRDPSKAAARGLRWGEPVMESGITLIHGGTYYYRGHDAIELARTWLLEDVAALLWSADTDERSRLFAQRSVIDARTIAQLMRLAPEVLPRVQAALPIAAASDVAAYDLRPAAVRTTGARILRLMTALIAGRDSQQPVHRVLQEVWAAKRPAVADVIRAALVLCADHELNVSAFTARCAASAGASPYDVVSAAMAAFRGYKHGGASGRVQSIVRHADTPREARATLVAMLRQGERVAGFGHPLYPAGDPRAAALLALAEASGNDRAWRPFRNLIKAGADVLTERPNLDTALAARRDAPAGRARRGLRTSAVSGRRPTCRNAARARGGEWERPRVAPVPEPDQGGRRRAHRAPEPRHRARRGDARLPSPRRRPVDPLRPRPHGRVDCAGDRGVCVRSPDPAPRALHGSDADHFGPHLSRTQRSVRMVAPISAPAPAVRSEVGSCSPQ
ncbi:MAG TPA: citrate/2-methylcitrate synthase, partial [Gemmatimonadaceae bacterium]|nr:citrate/2-methylcitrate synthase [Gemmatimonadaceae bacterium]